MTEPRHEVVDGVESYVWPGIHETIARLEEDPELVLTADPFEVTKHASHDQSSHGNWARGGRSVSQDMAHRTVTEGGASNRGTTGAVPKTGKVVATHPERSVVYKKPLNEGAIAAAIQKYREDNADLLGSGTRTVGAWRDPETGYLWLDIGTIVQSAEVAATLARQHNQIAYYDIDEGTEVRTGGTGSVSKRRGLGRLRGWFNSRGGAGADEGGDAVLRSGRQPGGDRSDGGGVFDPFGVLKHASHDQKSHGNWARGGGRTPTRMLPQGLQSHPLASRVHELVATAESIEPEVTDTLVSLAEQNGGEMTGLEFRFKQPDGILDKIERKVRDKNHGLIPDQVEITDALRYTMTFDADRYADGVLDAITGIEEQGWELASNDIENNWSLGDAYNGINTVFTHSSGLRVELQFHTPESWDVKMRNHHDYQFLRSGEGEPMERFQAFERMQELSDSIPLPDTKRLADVGVKVYRPFRKAAMRYFVLDNGALIRFVPENAMTQRLAGTEWVDAPSLISIVVDPSPEEPAREVEAPKVEKRLAILDVVTKHATHDQKDHGNWSGGDGNKVPATTSIKQRSMPNVDTDRLHRRRRHLVDTVLADTSIFERRADWMQRIAEVAYIENELERRGESFGERYTGRYDPETNTLSKHANHDQKTHGNWARLSGEGIDPSGLPDKFRASMERRAAKLGITPEMLDATLQAALDRGNHEHAEWYDIIHERAKDMAEQHGVDLGVAAGVIAALSPAREFGKNMRDAEQMLRVFEENKPFTPSQEDIDAYNERRDAKRPIAKPGTFKPKNMDVNELVALHPELNSLGNKTGLVNVVRAASIIRGGDIDQLVSGPKMRSFYSNIANPAGSRVTIDTWMYRAMIPRDHVFDAGVWQGTLSQVESEGRKVQNLFQGSPGALKGTGVPSNVGLYPMFAESVQRVAAANDLRPHAVQAIVWEVARVDAGYTETNLEDFR